MIVPGDYKGPQVEILVRDLKQDNTNEVIDKVLSNIKVKPAKVGLFLKDEEDGDFTSKVIQAVESKGFTKTDMLDFMDRANQVKLKREVENVKTACSFLKWNFDNIVGEVEYIIDEEKHVKHSAIQKKIEGMVEKSDSFTKFCTKNNALPELFEYPIPLLIQSGENFQVNKFLVESDQKVLNSETVYINVIGKYRDMNAMASRTLLVNPEEDQKKAYQLAYEAFDVCLKNLVPGEPISKAYIAARDYIREKDERLGASLHTNFGFGIGYRVKEDLLVINETNQTIVKPNMVFHVRITMKEVNKKPQRSVIALGDTVLITEEGEAVILTKSIQRKYSEISYSLEVLYSAITLQSADNEEDVKMKEAPEKKKEKTLNTDEDILR